MEWWSWGRPVQAHRTLRSGGRCRCEVKSGQGGDRCSTSSAFFPEVLASYYKRHLLLPEVRADRSVLPRAWNFSCRLAVPVRDNLLPPQNQLQRKPRSDGLLLKSSKVRRGYLTDRTALAHTARRPTSQADGGIPNSLPHWSRYRLPTQCCPCRCFWALHCSRSTLHAASRRTTHSRTSKVTGQLDGAGCGF